MKKFFNIFMVVATIATTFVSCSKELENNETPTPSGKMKTVTVKTNIATKTTLDSNHENLLWSAGDVIKIFNNADTTSVRAPYVAGGDLVIEVPETTTEIYAHYPYYRGNNTGPKSVSVYIGNTQTQKNPGELNGYNYPMVAKGTVSADNKALISLYPVASALALNIYHTGLDGEEKIKSVTVTPTANTQFIGSQVTDLTGDNITFTTAASSDPITVTLTNSLTLTNSAPADKQTFNGQIYVCLAKQSYKSVKFEIATTKGTYTITSSATVPFDCVNNDFVPVNINLAKAQFKEMEPLADGLYVISTVFGDTEYMMVANATAKFQSFAAISSDLDEDGKLIVDPTAAWKITYNSSEKNYSIQSFEYGTFFGGLGDKTDLPLKSEMEKDVFTITEQGDGYHINSSYGRWIAFNNNNGDPRFAMYKNDSEYPGVVKISPAKTTAVPSITFSWDEREVAAAMESVDFPFEGKYISTLPTVTIKEGSDAIIAENGISVSEDKITVALIPNEEKVVKQAILVVSSEEVPSLPELKIIQKAKPEEDAIAPTNTILWAEDWTNATTSNAASADATPSANYGKGTIVWNGETVTYAQSANSVYVRNENTGGGTKPELLLTSGETWTVSNIVTGSAKTLSLTWSSNNTNTTISVSPSTVSVTGSSKNYTIKPNGADQITILFSSNKNSRIDNVELKVEEAGSSVPATVTGISVENFTESFTASESGSYTFDGKVYAVYSDNSKVELAAGEYSVSGNVNLATAGTYQLTVSATINETVYSKVIAITVTETSGDTPDPVTMNIFSNQATITGTGASQTATWTSGDITVEAVRNDTSNTTFRSSDSDHTRFYPGWTITVSSAGKTISKVEFTCTTATYATTLGEQEFTKGSVTASGTTASVSTVDASATSVTLNSQVRVSSIKVIYK